MYSSKAMFKYWVKLLSFSLAIYTDGGNGKGRIN